MPALPQPLASSAALLPKPPAPEAPALLESPRSLLAALTLQRSQGSHKVQGVDFCADLGNFYPSCRAFGVKLLTEAGNMTTMCFPP